MFSLFSSQKKVKSEGSSLAWITGELGKYPDEIEVEVGADKKVNGDVWWAAWMRDWSGYSKAVDSYVDLFRKS